MARSRIVVLLALVASAAALAFALSSSKAQAQITGYTFVGGTARQQATVRAALAASSFDWSLVPGEITIHIAKGGSHAMKGEIWLDPALLAHGRAAWGVVQHEYAHQIDFLLFDDTVRARLTKLLGAKTWCAGRLGLRHSPL